MFAANATDALNLAIQGMVRAGDHVVSTRLEHNSVLRPLWHLRRRGLIDFDLVPFDGAGLVDPADVARALRPATRLVVVSHASQVLGTVQPVAEIAAAAPRAACPCWSTPRRAPARCRCGCSRWRPRGDRLHRPQGAARSTGSGGLVVAPEPTIATTRFGGTGVDSESLEHTPAWPHRLEAGTLNFMGIIGLGEGLAYVEARGRQRRTPARWPGPPRCARAWPACPA